MEQRKLGAQGPLVGVVGLGTWHVLDVPPEDEPARARVIDAALDAGANLFDSSPMYGRAEGVLARLLARRRPEAVVATKVWTRSAEEGREQIARAMRWFGDRVDVYQLHNVVAWKEHLPRLEALRDEGKVGLVGATHYSHAAFDELEEVMRTGRIAQVQIPYNPTDRLAEKRLLPLAAELGLGVLVMQPLGVGKLARRTPGAADMKRLEAFGVTTWPQAVLKWILSDPRVHAAIPATRSVAHMQENAAAGEPPWFDQETRDLVARIAEAA